MGSREITSRTGLKVFQRPDASVMGLRGAGTSADVRKAMPCGKCPRPNTAGPSQPNKASTRGNAVARPKSARQYIVRGPRGSNLDAPGTSREQPSRMASFGRASTSRQPPGRRPEKQTKKKPIEPLMRSDPLQTELIYYNAVLKVIGPTLSSPDDRKLIQPWLDKLYKPEFYTGQDLRDKRNRLLYFLITSVLNDEAFGLFHEMPPKTPIPDHIPIYEPPLCAWQVDTTWEDVLVTIPPENLDNKCMHDHEQCVTDDSPISKMLDEEFRFLLYVVRPLIELFAASHERDRLSAWLQVLCAITPDACVLMKGIRNDYMMALFAYASDLRLAGPFAEYPVLEEPLQPLAKCVKPLADAPSYLDPCGYEADEFLSSQPIPDEGAFCYIAVTGEMLAESK